MPATYLDAIVSFHRQRAAADERRWDERLENLRVSRTSFLEALAPTPSGNVAVIAEIKKRSPSKGWLAPDLNVATMARCYADGGARAISCLTDAPHFGGSFRDLSQVAEHVNLPILRKDFTITANDVVDAAEMGASAVLLIAAILDDDELRQLHDLAVRIGLTALVETHSVDDVQRAIGVGATVIGVNQRNLVTFEVDHRHAASLAAVIPDTVIRVAESGLRNVDDVRVAADAGFHAVLVGEAFVSSPNPTSLVRDFSSVGLGG